MAEVRRVPQAPKVQGSAVEQDKTEEYDGQGNRLHAVRLGKVDAELVQNGLTSFPMTGNEAKTDDHTGRFIAVTPVGLPKGREEQHKPTLFAAGDVVEGMPEDELRTFLTDGVIRRETKDEARDGDERK